MNGRVIKYKRNVKHRVGTVRFADNYIKHSALLYRAFRKFHFNSRFFIDKLSYGYRICDCLFGGSLYGFGDGKSVIRFCNDRRIGNIRNVWKELIDCSCFVFSANLTFAAFFALFILGSFFNNRPLSKDVLGFLGFLAALAFLPVAVFI